MWRAGPRAAERCSWVGSTARRVDGRDPADVAKGLRLPCRVAAALAFADYLVQASVVCCQDEPGLSARRQQGWSGEVARVASCCRTYAELPGRPAVAMAAVAQVVHHLVEMRRWAGREALELGAAVYLGGQLREAATAAQ